MLSLCLFLHPGPLCFLCIAKGCAGEKGKRRKENTREQDAEKDTGKAQVEKKDNFIDEKNFLVSLWLDHKGFIFPHFYTRNNEVNDIQRYFQPVLFLPYVSLVRWTLIKTPFL